MVNPRILRLLTRAQLPVIAAWWLYFGTGAIVEALTNSGIMHNPQLWRIFHPPDPWWFTKLAVISLALLGATLIVSRLAKRELQRRLPQ